MSLLWEMDPEERKVLSFLPCRPLGGGGREAAGESLCTHGGGRRADEARGGREGRRLGFDGSHGDDERGGERFLRPPSPRRAGTGPHLRGERWPGCRRNHGRRPGLSGRAGRAVRGRAVHRGGDPASGAADGSLSRSSTCDGEIPGSCLGAGHVETPDAGEPDGAVRLFRLYAGSDPDEGAVRH